MVSFLHLLGRGSKKEQTFGAIPLQFTRRLTKIKPSYAEMVGRYLCESRIKCAVDELVDVSVGMGFHTSYNTKNEEYARAKIVVDDFCENVGMDNINSEMARDIWICGNGIFWEKTPKKLDDLTRVPIASITKLRVDPNGKVLELEQKFGDNYPEIVKGSDVKNLKHIAFNRVDNGLFGRGLLEPYVRRGYGYKYKEGDQWKTAYRPSLGEINEEVEDMMRVAIIRYAPKYVFEMGGFSSDDAEALNTKLNTMSWADDLTVWYKGDASKQKFTANRLSTDPRSRLDPFIDHFVDKELIATQTPAVKLISEEGFTEASSRTAMQIEIRKVAAFQRFFKRIEEREIFVPVIMSELGWTRKKATDANVRLNWGPLDKPQVSPEFLISALQFGGITIKEFRKNIAGMGVELLEGEEENLEDQEEVKDKDANTYTE